MGGVKKEIKPLYKINRYTEIGSIPITINVGATRIANNKMVTAVKRWTTFSARLYAEVYYLMVLLTWGQPLMQL